MSQKHLTTDQLSEVLTQVVENLGSITESPDEGMESDADVNSNALPGPFRVYKGEKREENDFFIWSKVHSLTEELNREQRAKLSTELERKASILASRENSEQLGLQPKEQVISLEKIRVQLQSPNSVLARLFFERRKERMLQFLERFSKIKTELMLAKTERDDSGRTANDEDDVLKFEIAFEKTILKRIDVIRIQILTEFRNLNITDQRLLNVRREFKVLSEGRLERVRLTQKAKTALERKVKRKKVAKVTDTEAEEKARLKRRGFFVELSPRKGKESRGQRAKRLREESERAKSATKSDDDDDDDDDDEQELAMQLDTASGGTSTQQSATTGLGRSRLSTPNTLSRTQDGLRMGLINAIDSINNMIGLNVLKNSVAKSIVNALIQSEGDQFKNHINILLFGQPGTGKTASAKKIGNIFRFLGIVPLLRDSDFESFDRSVLVGGFAGQTSPKTRQAFGTAFGSVMFIDEIYSLNQGERDEQGHEAIDALVKESETYKGLVLIIGAGYENRIKKSLFTYNVGFASRFPNQWSLPNYFPSQLSRIIGIGTRLAPSSLSAMMGVLSFAPSGGRASVLTPLQQLLQELIGRAWELNMFEDTNARGALNLKVSIRREKSSRIFQLLLANKRRSFVPNQEPTIELDVYRGFTQWAKAEKNVDVIFVNDALMQSLPYK